MCVRVCMCVHGVYVCVFSNVLPHHLSSSFLFPFSFLSLSLQAFMFESSFSMAVIEWREKTCGTLSPDYHEVWQTIKKNFNPDWKPEETE